MAPWDSIVSTLCIARRMSKLLSIMRRSKSVLPNSNSELSLASWFLGRTEARVPHPGSSVGRVRGCFFKSFQWLLFVFARFIPGRSLLMLILRRFSGHPDYHWIAFSIYRIMFSWMKQPLAPDIDTRGAVSSGHTSLLIPSSLSSGNLNECLDWSHLTNLSNSVA